MAKNKIYYMILGIGLGMIISSAMNLAFNKPKMVEYTDEEIKEKAKSLGMISIKENIENKQNEKQEEIKQEPIEESKRETNREDKTPSKKGYKSITIAKGDDANKVIEKLRDQGLIDNSDDFRNLLRKYKLDTKFTTGTHQINIESSKEEIIKKLIQEKDLKEVGFL